MANKKDIELVLQAKFEADSSAESSASQMGQKIAQALEAPFSQLAEKFGQAIAAAIQRNVSNIPGASGGTNPLNPSANAVFSANPQQNAQIQAMLATGQQSPSGMTTGFGPILGPNGWPVMPAGSGPQQPPPFTGNPPPQNQSDPMSDTKNDSQRVAGATGSRINGFASLVSSTLNGLGSNMGLAEPQLSRFNIPGMDIARSADAAYQKFQLFQTARQFDKTADMSDFGLSKEALKEAGKNMTSEAMGAGPKIAALIESISKLQGSIDSENASLKEMKKSTDEATQRQARDLEKKIQQDEKMLQEQQMAAAHLENTTATMFRQGAAMTSAGTDTPLLKSRSFWGGVGTAAEIGAVGADFMANRTASVARGEAGTVALNNFGSRMAFNRDTASILAMNMAGGEDELRRSATSSENWSMVGQGLLGVASGVGAYFAGGPTNPLGLALSGAALKFGAGAYSSFTERDAAIAGRMKELTDISYGKNQEALGIFSAARGNAVGAFQTAVGMGSSSYSRFLSGVDRGGGYMTYAPPSLGGVNIDTTPVNQRFTPVNGPSYGVAEGVNETAIMAYAHQGFSKEQTLADLAAYRGVAGAYGGRDIMREAPIGALINEGAKLRAQGFNSIAASSAAYAAGNDLYRDVNGADNFENRMTQAQSSMMGVQNFYKNVRGAGFEEGSGDRITQMMTGYGATGIGAMGNSEEVARMALAQAQSIGATSGGQAMNIMKMAQTIDEKSMKGDPFAQMARLQSMDTLKNELAKKGVKLTPQQELMLQRGKWDAKTLEKEFGVDAQTAKTLSTQFKGDVQKHTLEGYQRMGGELGEEVFAEQNAPGDSYADRKLAIDAAKSGKLATDLKTDVQAPPKDKAFGQDESRQDAESEGKKVVEGTKLLQKAMDILEEAFKKAAANVEKIASTTDFGKAEKERAAQEAKESEARRDIALGSETHDLMSMARANTMANQRMTPATPKGNPPGKKPQ